LTGSGFCLIFAPDGYDDPEILRPRIPSICPTGADGGHSWLNAVETFFAKLTRRRLRRGSFPSLVSLQEAINCFVAVHNRDPRPFVWTADPDRIVEKVRRGYQTLARMAERRAE
jgi:hypothetical protein